MNSNFVKAHNQYLEPPDEDPICEDGCGETMKRDNLTHEWFCDNKFCPNKFDGVAREMAEMLIGANETVKSLSKQLSNIRNGRDLVYGMRRD